MSLFRRKKINRASIKESFDNLPAGICFTDKRGIVILCNRQMHRLCQVFLGTDVQHIYELRCALQRPPQTLTRLETDGMVYRLPDGEIWQFSETALQDAGGTPYTQVVATDVTALHEKELELEKENQLLSEANARAVKLYSELDRTVREEENFAIKTRVHDEVGMALLQTRRLLEESDDLDELKKVGAVWRRIAETLGLAKEAEACPEADRMEELRQVVAGIGVTLSVMGDVPTSQAAAYLLSVAIRECATNAVRHAGGSKVLVEIERQAGAYRISISNNGTVPTEPIREGGGLSSLRKRIETADGTMTVEGSPAFCLHLMLPEKEN